MNKNPFIPKPLPLNVKFSKNLIKLIGEANNSLGKLNGLLTNISNPMLLLTPLITAEAVSSTRIEGTQATIEDIYKHEADETIKENYDDTMEVLNYRKALYYALTELKKKPICENLIKHIHFIILDSVRGENKNRGKFRSTQVFIGKQGDSIDKAEFIPPPAQEIQNLFKNFESYINSTEEIDPLIQIGIAHYQFETIHPFLDGNGRIGRLLIPLFLYEKKMLDFPVLYISEFFEENRLKYYTLLNNVRKNNELEEWLDFFLAAVKIQSNKACEKILKIYELYNKLKIKIIELNSPYSIALLDIMFANPIISFKLLKQKLKAKSNQTIFNLLDKFIEEKLLTETSNQKRNKQYAFNALLKILRNSK